ncbi:hypothetical protein J7M28_04655, partial [bacterium]|nr:hypothetical protein [bacterium]
SNIPCGLLLQPYVEFDYGIGIGASVGPAMFIWGVTEFSDIPVGLDVRYTPFYDASFTPYIRAGGRYHIAWGEFVENSRPGISGGLGLEIGRGETVGMALELSYDNAWVEIEKYRKGWSYDNNGVYGKHPYRKIEEIKPSEAILSFMVFF